MNRAERIKKAFTDWIANKPKTGAEEFTFGQEGMTGAVEVTRDGIHLFISSAKGAYKILLTPDDTIKLYQVLDSWLRDEEPAIAACLNIAKGNRDLELAISMINTAKRLLVDETAGPTPIIARTILRLEKAIEEIREEMPKPTMVQHGI